MKIEMFYPDGTSDVFFESGMGASILVNMMNFEQYQPISGIKITWHTNNLFPREKANGSLKT